MGQKQKTTEWFIAKAKSIYGDKFDYSKSVYSFSSIPIEIICKIHGSFWQRSDEHFKGNGCPICNRRWTLESFIEKSNVIHDGKYDYSKIIESSFLGETKLTITCKTHGPFQQKAKDHIRNRGCNLCGRDRMKESQRLTHADFINKSKEIHGNQYDYSKAIYTKTTEKTEIICFIHGSFWQTPSNHMHKILQQGCPTCAGNIRLTTNQFIQKANDVHGNEYDYTLAEYIDSKTKIIVVCKKHGEFHVIPSNHFKGKKCPKCKFRVSKPETAWLDSLKIPKDCRQKTLLMNSGKRYEVDAYNPETNTVYEFNGDYWHGNPAKFDGNAWNHRNHCTFGELYQKTLTKERELILNNYNVISIWENDFKKYISLSKNNSLKPFAD